jgi:hypothetical protein
MNAQDMAERRMHLLRKRWDGAIESDEQDELDDLTEALKLLHGSWSERYGVVVAHEVEA